MSCGNLSVWCEYHGIDPRSWPGHPADLPRLPAGVESWIPPFRVVEEAPAKPSQ